MDGEDKTQRIFSKVTGLESGKNWILKPSLSDSKTHALKNHWNQGGLLASQLQNRTQNRVYLTWQIHTLATACDASHYVTAKQVLNEYILN